MIEAPQFTRRQILILSGLGLANICVCLGGGINLLRLSDTAQPVPTPPDTTATDLTPANSPAASPTRSKDLLPPPTKEIRRNLSDFFYVGPLNFLGIIDSKTGRISPAPELIGTITVPDRPAKQPLKFSVIPKMFEENEDPGVVFDYRQEANRSFPNIVGIRNESPEGFVIQTGHSASALGKGDLPLEALRQYLEDNGKPFTRNELAKNVEKLKNASVSLTQGPATVAAKIVDIIRINPNQVTQINADRAAKKAVNILDYANADQKISLDYRKCFDIEFCGQSLLRDDKNRLIEVANPKIPYFLQTRYHVLFTLTV